MTFIGHEGIYDKIKSVLMFYTMIAKIVLQLLYPNCFCGVYFLSSIFCQTVQICSLPHFFQIELSIISCSRKADSFFDNFRFVCGIQGYYILRYARNHAVSSTTSKMIRTGNGTVAISQICKITFIKMLIAAIKIFIGCFGADRRVMVHKIQLSHNNPLFAHAIFTVSVLFVSDDFYGAVNIISS